MMMTEEEIIEYHLFRYFDFSVAPGPEPPNQADTPGAPSWLHRLESGFASANLPSIIMLLFWPKTTAPGIVASIGVGIVAALGIILTGPAMFAGPYGLTAADAWHPLGQPGIISIPLSFLTLVVVSLMTQKKKA